MSSPPGISARILPERKAGSSGIDCVYIVRFNKERDPEIGPRVD